MKNSKPHILIVDDELDIRETLKEIIRIQFDFPVLVGANGNEGLKLIQSHDVAVLITDLSMPIINGFELLRRMKSQGIQLPTIVLTGNADKTILPLLKNYGVSEFLTKPWSNQSLIEIIENLLKTPSHGTKAS